VIFSPDGGLMIAVYIAGVNFTNTSITVFDVFMTQQIYGSFGTLINATVVPM
jgi:hypothetical protein